MKKNIIVINGSGGVGKDTFVSICSEFKKVLNISTVDKVKEAANILVDWNGDKDEKYRKLLVDLKKLSIDYNDAPTNYICKKAEEFMKSDDELMFIHIREGYEIDKVKKLLPIKTLLITNPNIELIISNASDKKVTEYKYDYYIDNNGTIDDLRLKALDFVKKL